jgi:hypothetical protein
MIYNMPEPTNLTERLSHLRDRKGRSPLVKGSGAPEPSQRTEDRKKQPERRLASDYFMLFVYALLAVALIAQMALIAWLDVI